jgi:hypothetical protein
MNFEKPDRNLIWEMGYWLGTVNRWYEEGLPKTHGLPIAGDPGMGVRAEAFPHDPLSVSRDRNVHEAMSMDLAIFAMPLNLSPQPPFEPVKQIFNTLPPAWLEREFILGYFGKKPS